MNEAKAKLRQWSGPRGLNLGALLRETWLAALMFVAPKAPCST